jgi:Protein of unknown function (DUF1573)
MITLALSFLFLLQTPAIVGPSHVWLSPTTYNFGDLEQGVPAHYDFKFKNTGDVPIQIENVRFVCSCTATEWTETPVMPGKEGFVKIEYDARKLGYFSKKITVFFTHLRKGEKLFVEGFVE